MDDLSDEELSNEETEENHQGSDNNATCTNLTSLADEVEANSSDADANKSSEDSPAVNVENADDNVKDDSKITKSTSPSSESSRDEKETKDETVTESIPSISDDNTTTENSTTPTLDAFEVSSNRLIMCNNKTCISIYSQLTWRSMQQPKK